jgi:hypothetical protein
MHVRAYLFINVAQTAIRLMEQTAKSKVEGLAFVINETDLDSLQPNSALMGLLLCKPCTES